MYYPYGYYRRYPGFWPDPFYDMPRVVNIDPVQVSYTIECYKDQKKAPDDAFDTYLILKSLGQKIWTRSDWTGSTTTGASQNKITMRHT